MAMIFGCSREEAAKRFPELFAPDFLDRQWKQRQHVASARTPIDPANFGLAPGMRAMKAKRGKRNTAKLARIVDNFSRMTADTHPCWPVACHEAGHAVAALVCGMRLRGTSRFGLSYGPEVLGFCNADFRTVAPRFTGMVAYAGAAAESKATGKVSIPLTAADSGILDEAISRQLRGGFIAGGDGALRAAWKEGAKTLVSQSWPAIQAVATELRMRGHLGGDKVREIVAQHITLD
ncbi:MAG: hypothetical protein ACYC3G_02960 [Minisyncoccota bacterium]